MKRNALYTAVVAAVLALAGTSFAADQTRDQLRTQDPTSDQLKTRDQDDPVYGSQLMTNQERIQYRNRMRAAKTVEEREQIRLEHHKQMQERAKERGVTLPDVPPPRGSGRGMGPGAVMGGGAGPGAGYGRR
jgi:hypothetical protein